MSKSDKCSLPLDLQINILLVLPSKSLFRFRCVSKLWYSIITSRDFRNWRLNITAPPRLLITFADFYGEKIMVASTPNPNAPSYSSSSKKDLILVNTMGRKAYNACQGLICVGAGFKDVGICNPSTRQVHNFPYLEFKFIPQNFPMLEYMLGYDPVEDQYKVLAVDEWPARLEHKIVVLGGKKTWREVPCVAYPHLVQKRCLYMNGTIYYGASTKGASMKDIDSPDESIIVSFDVRLETFNIIKILSKVVPGGYKNMWLRTPWVLTDKILINYHGKIGVVETPRKGSFRMWVVEDAEKEVWSMNTFALPESVAGFDFKVMETFSTGEVCLVRKEFSDPFCLFYYDLEEKSMRSVTIQGLPMSELKQAQALTSDSFFCVSFQLHAIRKLKTFNILLEKVISSDIVCFIWLWSGLLLFPPCLLSMYINFIYTSFLLVPCLMTMTLMWLWKPKNVHDQI